MVLFVALVYWRFKRKGVKLEKRTKHLQHILTLANEEKFIEKTNALFSLEKNGFEFVIYLYSKSSFGLGEFKNIRNSSKLTENTVEVIGSGWKSVNRNSNAFSSSNNERQDDYALY